MQWVEIYSEEAIEIPSKDSVEILSQNTQSKYSVQTLGTYETRSSTLSNTACLEQQNTLQSVLKHITTNVC